MTHTLDYHEATGDARDEPRVPCFEYASPNSPPLPIERQRPGTVDTRSHVSACYATIAAQVGRYQLLHKAYHHWQAIEAKTPNDHTPGEEYFVNEMRQMECKYGWLRGQPLDNECAGWIDVRVHDLVSGVPPPNWLATKRARARAAKEAVTADNHRARTGKPSSPIAKSAAAPEAAQAPAAHPPLAPKAVRRLSRYPPKSAVAVPLVSNVALKVASASIAGAAR